MYKIIPVDEFYRLINHGPCVFITSGTPEKSNIAPIAWISPVNNDPPLVVIVIDQIHYTAELIEHTKEFAINIPDVKLLTKLIGSGKISGRKEDKIKKFNIVTLPGHKIKTLHLAEAIGYIECQVLDKHTYDGVILFIGKVLYAAVKEDLYDGYLIPEKSPNVHHLGGDWFLVGEKRIKV